MCLHKGQERRVIQKKNNDMWGTGLCKQLFFFLFLKNLSSATKRGEGNEEAGELQWTYFGEWGRGITAKRGGGI